MRNPERATPVSSESPERKTIKFREKEITAVEPLNFEHWSILQEAERNIRSEMEKYSPLRVSLNDKQAHKERLRLAVELVRVRQLMREEAREPYLNFDVIGS